MKIGVLTFCNANNYGAALQAFALQKKLEQMGHAAELVDYRCTAIEATHAKKTVTSSGISLKKRIYNFLYNVVFSSRGQKFEAFRKRVKRSKCYQKSDLFSEQKRYDLFIAGSDQVFNFALTGHDETFFLDFVDQKDKKVAYAASMGSFIDAEKETYAKLLKDFRLLSVREKSTALQIENKLGIACEVVPDPVFLYSAEQWKEIIGLRVNPKNKPYVLIYTLFESPELYRLAKEYAKQNHCEVIAITKSLRPGGKADTFVRDAGPQEFLEFIMNAKYVVTDSFHGTAFSLIFGKQLKIVMPPKAQNRIIDLLSELGIEQDFTEVDYEQVQKKLASYRETGIQFLDKINN